MRYKKFGPTLGRFLDNLGLVGERNRWFNDQVGSDPRYLRRWIHGTVLPSKESWSQIERAVKQRWGTESHILADLAELERILSHERGKKFRARRNPPTHTARVWPGVSRRAQERLNVEAEDLCSRFLVDTRIAAQLTTSTGRCAVYLDDVYIHRSVVESAVRRPVEDYLAHGGTTGRWLSIAGDAGHGKTSLLWFLTQEFRRLCSRTFPVQALQFSADALEKFFGSFGATGAPFIVVLDTLDLMVGVNNAGLGALINQIRARGGFLVTACRRQELQSLARHVRSDQTVDLGRYTTDEAHAAIERYVRTSYTAWPEVRKQTQIDHVRELLDERRRIQDLSFEPLILRMIFEAYVPDDIPTDINTQKVYDRFWEERVVTDRVLKTSEEAYTRETICELLASHLYFSETAHSEHAPVDEIVALCGPLSLTHPLATIEGLISSGVMRWWQMQRSVGFFHQTFLEYVAAKHILRLRDRTLRQARVDRLLADAEESNLFRIPVLKQLMIQASVGDRQLFEGLCADVAEINSPVSARLALEVLGKAHETAPLASHVREWMSREPTLFRAVALECVRHYPASRVELAFEMLRPQLDAQTIVEICSTCEAFFVPMAPERTLAFLLESWRARREVFRGREDALKTAFISALRAGDHHALDGLSEVFPTLSAGVQAGTLDALANAWMPDNVSAALPFLSGIFDSIASSESNEPRAAYVRTVESLHRAGPLVAGTLAQTLRKRAAHSLNLKTRMLLAQIIGISRPTESEIEEAFIDLQGSEHIRRLSAGELLHQLAKVTDSVMERLLNLPAGPDLRSQTINTIYRVASGSRNPDLILGVLDRWTPTERGAGEAYRELLENAANANPTRTLAWLKAWMNTSRTAARKRQVLVGFQILALSARSSICPEDFRELFKWGFLSPDATDEMKRIVANTTGLIAEIDAKLAHEMLQRIFQSPRSDLATAAISSLRTVDCPDFLVAALDLTLRRTASDENFATFGQFFHAVAHSSVEARTAILGRLTAPDARRLIKLVKDPAVVSRILGLLKSVAKRNVAMVLDLAAICPLINNGNAAMLSAVLENATGCTAEPQLLRRILNKLLALANIPHHRVRNSLLRAVPRLDKLLPHREVAEAVLAAILSNKSPGQKGLENLARAAKRMESWTPDDTESVIRSTLPPRVKAALLH
jgi:hypothetical protein